MKIDGCGSIITGGASGLGEATARLLSELGARVSIFDLDEERGRQLARDIDGHFARVDIAEEDSVQHGLEQAIAAHGDIGILVNCAGMAYGEKITSKGRAHALASFEHVLRINLIGTFNCIRLVATRMTSQDRQNQEERGVIINTASVVAFDGQVGQAAYAASKNAIVGMTLPIARDLSREGIRVMTIAPGVFDTPMMAGLPEDARKLLEAGVPCPARLGKAQEFASLVREICENAYLNGETIRLDGALRLAVK